MRCKKCGYCTNKTKAICWKEWQLCFDCAKTEHPERYSIQHKARKIRNRTPSSRYQLCQKCNEVTTRLFYTKFPSAYRINAFYCRNCKVITLLDSTITINNGVVN